MAKVETDYQLDIKKSITHDGYFAFKLSNRYTVGVPDLAIWIPPFVPLLAEVKRLTHVKPGFERKINFSPLQEDTMKRSSEKYEEQFGMTAVCLVIVEWETGERDLVAVPRYGVTLADGYQGGRAWSRKTIVGPPENRRPYYYVAGALAGLDELHPIAKAKPRG